MKKTITRTKSKKKHFYSFGGRYKKSTQKHRMAKVLTAVIILVAVAAAATGILVVDHNSRIIGWGEKRSELAFAVSPDRADITIMGQEYYIDTGAVTQAGRIYAQLARGLDYLKPAPIRLLDMLYIYVKDRIGNFI
jgi:hypothetical protein